MRLNRTTGHLLFPAAAMTAVVAAAAYFIPYALDNHTFELMLLRSCPDGLTADGIGRYIAALASDGAVCLPDVLSPLVSLYLPKWLFALLTGLAAAFTGAAATCIAMGRNLEQRSRLATCNIIYVYAAMLVFLPWFDNLLVGFNAIACIWGCAVAFASFLGVKLAAKGRLAVPISFLAGVVCGLWGAGIAVPVAVGALAVGVRSRFARLYIPYYILGSTSLLVAAALFVFSNASTVMSWPEVASFAASNCLPLILVAAMALSLIFRVNLPDRIMFTFFAASAVTAALLSIFNGMSTEASCWGNVSALAALGIWSEPFVARNIRPWVSVAVGLSGVVMSTVGVLQCRLVGENYDEFVASVAKSPGGTVFGPSLMPADIPAWLPQFAPRGLLAEPGTYAALAGRYGHERVSLVPIELGFSLPEVPEGHAATTNAGSYYMEADSTVGGAYIISQDIPVLASPYAQTDTLRAPILALPFASRRGTLIFLQPL